MYQRGDRTILTIAFLLFIAMVTCGCFILGGCITAPQNAHESFAEPGSMMSEIVTNQPGLSDDMHERPPQADEIHEFGPPEDYDLMIEHTLPYIWPESHHTRSAESQVASDSRATTEDVYRCYKATEDIHLDGRLDESAWSRAEVIKTWFWLGSNRQQATVETRAMLLWDNRYLYIAFDCRDEDVMSFTDQDDDDLWNGDVVELFLKPSKRLPVYYEWEIAPNGALFDARHPSRSAMQDIANRRWDSGARISLRVTGTEGHPEDRDTGWVVEAAIPLFPFSRDVPLPRDGTQWTFAVCRYDYSHTRGKPRMTVSSPGAEDGFHSHEVYKTIRFTQ